MVMRTGPSKVTALQLPEQIGDEVMAWRNQGYLLLSESLFRDNRGMSFTGLLALMRKARDGVVAAEQGTLFA